MSSLQVEPIGRLPEGCFANAATSDGHVVAFCPMPDGRLMFAWDGALGAPFDIGGKFRDGKVAVFVSGDGCHVAYLAVRGEHPFVGRDGGEDPPIVDFSMSMPPTFDHAGRHLAYGARSGPEDEWHLVLDGVAGEGLAAPIRPAFSADGSRFAYVEMRGTGRQDVEHRIVLDGVPGDWLKMRNADGAMQFSPDGTRFAYYSVNGKGLGRWTVDGVAQRWINDVHPIGLAQLRGVGVLDPPLPAAFSPDSRRFAYFADVVEKGVAMIEDDRPGPPLKAIGHPMFSPDSRHLAYAAKTFQNRIAVYVDGAPIGEWEAVNSTDPTFSPDSGRVATGLEFEEGGLLRKHRLYALAIDGGLSAREPGTDSARHPIWSPDSRHVAEWRQRAAGLVVAIDGALREDLPAPNGEVAYDAANRLVYPTLARGSVTIAIDGRPGPSVEDLVVLRTAAEVFDHRAIERAPVPFRTSRDGRHVAWAGVLGGVAHPVLDDEIGPGFDDVIDCGFDDDGTVTWWAQRGTELVRVVLPASAEGTVRERELATAG